MTYEPQYQSSWPRLEDARPKGIKLDELEAKILLIEDGYDPLEAEDLKESQSMVRMLRRLRLNSL